MVEIMQWINIKDKLPPHDGKPFLGFDPLQEEIGRIYVLIYVPEFKYPEGNYSLLSHEAYYQEASGEGYFKWEPTHWMPLPNPPTNI